MRGEEVCGSSPSDSHRKGVVYLSTFLFPSHYTDYACFTNVNIYLNQVLICVVKHQP